MSENPYTMNSLGPVWQQGYDAGQAALTAERDALLDKLTKLAEWVHGLSLHSSTLGHAQKVVVRGLKERDGLKRELEVAQAACAEMSEGIKQSCARLAEEWYFPHLMDRDEDDSVSAAKISLGKAIMRIRIPPNPGALLIAELTKLRAVVKAGDVFARATSTALHDWHLLPENVPLNLRDGEVHCVDSVCVTFRESLAAYLAAKSALEVKG